MPDDTQEILTRLVRIETMFDTDIKQIHELLKEHNVLLHGKEGNNGIVTTISKMKSHWNMVHFVLGALIVAVIQLLF